MDSLLVTFLKPVCDSIFQYLAECSSVYLSLCCTRAAAAPRWWGFSLPNSL